MAITVEQKCTRCRRDVKHVMSDIQEAGALENLRVKREENAQRIEDFIKNLNPDELPSLVVVQRIDGATSGYNMLAMPTLCDFQGEGKRSCTARITELFGSMKQLEVRKKVAKPETPPALPTKLVTSEDADE